MRIAYRGNFQPEQIALGITPWSTETHIAVSLEELGHEVIRVQENEIDWACTVALADRADLFLWTSTFGFAHEWDQHQAHSAVAHLNTVLPTAAVHLDKFFDLPRQDQLKTEPWFKLNHVFTADGGNQQRFADLGINHHWMPPAVYAKEAVPGTAREEYTSDIAFVGSWRGGYHPEWAHRAQLIRYLRMSYRQRDKLKLWPSRGAVRGPALADLYASVKVVVGDSCLVGDGGHYISDRVPETLGRGGFLLHPPVQGVIPGLYEPGVHLDTYELYDWRGLGETIKRYLDDGELRNRMRLEGQRHVQAHHTYTVRMRQVLEVISGLRDTVLDNFPIQESV